MQACNYKEWEAAGLKDFGDYADCVNYCNQREFGDGQLEGDWYYFDEDTGILYYGTFGNYNSAGASHYTYAETDKLEAETMLSQYEAAPEYVEEDDENE